MEITEQENARLREEIATLRDEAERTRAESERSRLEIETLANLVNQLLVAQAPASQTAPEAIQTPSISAMPVSGIQATRPEGCSWGMPPNSGEEARPLATEVPAAT